MRVDGRCNRAEKEIVKPMYTVMHGNIPATTKESSDALAILGGATNCRLNCDGPVTRITTKSGAAGNSVSPIENEELQPNELHGMTST